MRLKSRYNGYFPFAKSRKLVTKQRLACANKKYTNIEQLPLVLSVEQLADVLGIGLNNAYQLVRSSSIRSVRIGRQYKIPKDALEVYLTA